MFDSGSSDLAENVPSIGIMSIYTQAIFGNTNFMLAPSQTGPINYSYGQMPYYSLEGQLSLQELFSQTQPQSITPGQHTGQQNITGQYTVTGAAGNIQVAIGSATTASGSF